MNSINQAISILKQGGLVGLPTETVYGLAADAKNPIAVQKVFAAKGRPADHPLIVHIGSIAELTEWAIDIPHEAYRLAEHYWPGPLTLILKKQKHVLNDVTGGQDTVALRMPNHPLALALLKAFGSGLVAPSANQFGRISPTDAEAVYAELQHHVDLILPGGRSQVGIESTILDLHQKPFTLLRQGMLGKEALEAFLGEALALPNAHTTVRAPGLLASHYAPRTPLKLLSSLEPEKFVMTKNQCILLAYSSPPSVPTNMTLIKMPQTPQDYAHALYATLRQADAQGADLILVETPPNTVEWTAILDRLKRAAA